MADLSSILGGMVQGFKDFGTGVVDLFGTGAANIGDIATSIATGRATTKNQDDFRKWLYQTDDKQDAAAKGLGTILNGVSTVADVIPGAQAVTANPLFNGLQGAIGGVSDELKMYGKDADAGRALQRAGVGAASGLASGYAGQGLGKSSSKLLNNGLTRGVVSGALGGGIANAGYTGIEGGSAQDMINAGLYGASTGALIGGTTGLARELIKPAHKMDVALTDNEKAARIANIDDQLAQLDTSTPEGMARYNELAQARQQYSGNKRLYRGLEQEYDPNYPSNKLDTNGYESWTDNPELARQYGKNVYYIDVPEGDIKTSYLDENPLSETYGDRNPIYSIDKKAGLNGVSGNEYLLSVDDPYKEGLTYNRLGSKPKTVADLMAGPKQKTVADLMLSPEQKDFFKDSAIRDENGNLRPMYHGTRGDFTVFGKNKTASNSNSDASIGYWFTPTEEGATKWANSIWYGDGEPKAMETYLNIKNPKIYETVDNSAAIEPLAKRLQELETKSLTSGKLSDTQLYYDDIYKASMVQNMVNQGNEDMAVKWLSDKGYSKENAANLVDEIAGIKRLADEKANIQNKIDELRYGDAYEQFRTDLYKIDGQTAGDANFMGQGMALRDKNSLQKYVDSLKEQGYDGIVIKGTNYDADVMGGLNDQYVVFDPNQIKDVNNLTPTLADDIMADRINPDQLDLFSQPKQKPTAKKAVESTEQLDLFSQPKPVEPENPYAPVGGETTLEMKDRAADYLQMADRNFRLDNELRNRIDPSTLPQDDIELRKIIASDAKPEVKQKKILELVLGGKDIQDASVDELLNYYYDGNQKYIDTTKRQITNKRISDDVAKKTIGKWVADKAKALSLDTVDTGFTATADTLLSERLGIAPSQTYKYNSKNKKSFDTRNALGRYNPRKKDISTREYYDAQSTTQVKPERALSTTGHERLHSFQGEAKPENAGRYNKEVVAAYNDLHNSLEKLYSDRGQIKQYWHGNNTDYYARPIEQEARMFQQYLEDKGYTESRAKGFTREFSDEINPAFDKFIDKLRDLSKRGIALPALTALFGGGAIMAATQNNDKEKKSEVK